MARRRATRKKSSSPSARMAAIVVTICVLLLIVVVVIFRSMEKPQASSDIPLDILSENASLLSNNNYALNGTVIDRFQRGESELVSFLYKDASGSEHIIPICISADVRNGLNLTRDQQYRIEFQVEDINPEVRGVCVATSIKPE